MCRGFLIGRKRTQATLVIDLRAIVVFVVGCNQTVPYVRRYGIADLPNARVTHANVRAARVSRAGMERITFHGARINLRRVEVEWELTPSVDASACLVCRRWNGPVGKYTCPVAAICGEGRRERPQVATSAEYSRALGQLFGKHDRLRRPIRHTVWDSGSA